MCSCTKPLMPLMVNNVSGLTLMTSYLRYLIMAVMLCPTSCCSYVLAAVWALTIYLILLLPWLAV